MARKRATGTCGELVEEEGSYAWKCDRFYGLGCRNDSLECQETAEKLNRACTGEHIRDRVSCMTRKHARRANKRGVVGKKSLPTDGFFQATVAGFLVPDGRHWAAACVVGVEVGGAAFALIGRRRLGGARSLDLAGSPGTELSAPMAP